MRILLIDDHEIVRRGLRQLLTEEWPHAEFGEVARMPQAREALALGNWDLVLLDINLPDGSGLDLLEVAQRHNDKTPVLVLSAFAEQEFAVRAFKLGAAGFLTKSSIGDEMSVAVRRVLTGKRYVSAVMADHLAAMLGSEHVQEPHEALSPRELEVLRMVAKGQTIKAIAERLSLSDKTVATYRARVSEKLGLSTNVDLARYALKHHLVD